MKFKPVTAQVDFPQLEKDILEWWYTSGVVEKYLHRNDNSTKKFSFLDGPITANNPMGVHHAWGRTYKDLWQRYHTLKGDAGRYQNGFDCQGLWVEVEVEKELGFKSKKDIESYGIANFVNKCKERVIKYSGIQTQQSQRLGYFMDWANSYFTMSDQNNYSIWEFLKVCWQRGWLYKGHESIPWCPRCETAISQHEMLTEDYKEVTHDSVYLKLPLVDKPNESLLIWTTTPWTIPANIAVAVDTKLEYCLVDGLWVAKEAAARLFPQKAVQKTVLGKKLVGLKYRGPYDDLDVVTKVASHPLFHTVVATDAKIMPITTTEGTGLVHTAVSAGEEDFKLGQKIGLPLIPVIADNADYLAGLGSLTGQNAKKHPEIILDFLTNNNWALKVEKITHRYPACWRCKAELVWKVADEWYISMDKVDPTDPKKRTLRRQMMDVAKKIKWLPSFGLSRELDWLKNMHDWLISKKNRYWGLALPIYVCPSCHNFEVIGSQKELEQRAVEGWDKFMGNSPHRPWIDEVKISCSKCQTKVSRILDVGNPWLDAGIVPFSTMSSDWFPADFITESFPGQFKNWFYAMIAMSTVLTKSFPYKTVLGFASLLAEDGRPMHKSWGNSIEFNEGADKIGVDVMRWMFAFQNPTDNLLFGFAKADETRRRFHITLWNIYNFFVTYANIVGWYPGKKSKSVKTTHVLDQWILIRLNQTISIVTKSLDKYSASEAAKSIEEFVSDLSLWYVRRSRERLAVTASDLVDREACFTTLHTVLVQLTQILAPFTPFISEEIYRNLTQQESVHLSNWPKVTKVSSQADSILSQMEIARKLVEMGLSQRKDAQIKVRQPLRTVTIGLKNGSLDPQITKLILTELNIKDVIWQVSDTLTLSIDLNLDPELIAEGKIREVARSIQDLRKELGALLNQQIDVTIPAESMANCPSVLIDDLKKKTLIRTLSHGDTLQVKLVDSAS